VSVSVGIEAALLRNAEDGDGRGRADERRLELRREHLHIQQRSHYVVTNGGDQPNVVRRSTSVWEG
jgi:hypothetical protein